MPPIPEGPYLRLSVWRDAVGVFSGVEYEEVRVPAGIGRLPVSGAIRMCFHELGRLSRWPQLVSGDATDFNILFFAQPLADAIVAAGFSGIEFHPVEFELGTVKKRLRDRMAERPTYRWGRVHGMLRVNLFYYGRPAILDAAGERVVEDTRKIAVGDRKVQVAAGQPEIDFAYPVPAGSGSGWFAISRRVAEFLQERKVREAIISSRGGGYL